LRLSKYFIYLILLFSSNFLFSFEKIDALFVSNISFDIADGKALISWKNPDNFKDLISIYRSDSKIENEERLLKSQKIATLSKNEDKFIDNPGKGVFYYAVIITGKESKKDNIILVPFRNFNVTPIEIKDPEVFTIKKIRALSNKYSITIEWENDNKDYKNRNVILYRSSEPIRKEDVLKKAIKIANLNIESKYYVDIPIPKINYYYAIFVENEPKTKFEADVNITKDPVFIESKTDLMNNFTLDNFIPLPLLSFENDPKTGLYFKDGQILKSPQKINYSNELLKIIENFKKDPVYSKYSKEKKESLKDIGFIMLKDEDIYTPKDYINEYETILSLLKKGDFKNSKFLLEQTMTEILPKDILKRCSYYLGVIYYLEKKYNLSYIQFSYSYSDFSKEILPYVASITNKLFDNLER